MGNPIQYRNTDNPSQIQGWVSHNKGGFRKWPLSLWYAPLGHTQRGVNENVSPATQSYNLWTMNRMLYLLSSSVMC